MSYADLVLSVNNLAEKSSELKVAAQNVQVAAEASRDSSEAFAIDALSSVTESQNLLIKAPLDAAQAAQVVLTNKVDRSELLLPDASNLIGWSRSALSSAVSATVGQMLLAMKVNLWEFSSYIRDKPNLNDATTWDWSPAAQAFVNYLTTNHLFGYVPPMKYKLTTKINVKSTYGWGIFGDGITSTEFVQYTDDTPIFDLGAIAGDSMHSYHIHNLTLNYANVQPATNLNATPIRFSAMGFQGTISDIRFLRGSWAIKVVSGIGAPWGQTWDNLMFGSGLTGGAMDWTGGVNAVPNNVWGRFFIDAANMTGPIFKEIKGYNWTWEAVEVISGVNCQWMSLQAGSELSLGAIKMELMDYTLTNSFTGSGLMYLPGCMVKIGQCHLGGTFCKLNPLTPTVLFSIATGKVFIDSLTHLLTQSPSNFWLISASVGGEAEIRITKRGTYNVPYSNVGSAPTADFITVYPDKNDKLSGNKGDANYTVVKGDPSLVQFETTFTAQRTVTLPADDYCFNGLKYRVASRGAVNGANTLLITAGGVTKGTLAVDKSYYEFTWRRNANPHAGWVITAAGTTP